MTRAQEKPIRRAPINNKGILYITPVPRLDRIQLSVQNTSDNYKRVKCFLMKDADSYFCHPLSGDREGEACEFHWGGKKITMRFERGFNFRINISQPDKFVQRFVKNIVLRGAKKGIKSLTQVEFALDYYSSNSAQLKRIERYLSRYTVMKGLRAKGTGRYQKKGTNTTYYQGKDGDVRKGDKGLTVYAKDGRVFCRVELKAHQPFLKRQGLMFESLPITPKEICVSDHNVLREMITEKSVRRLAVRYADCRMKKVKNCSPKRMEAIHRTLRDVFTSKLSSAASSDKTVAEVVDLLKRMQKKAPGFNIVLDRAFPPISNGYGDKEKIKIFPNYLGIGK